MDVEGLVITIDRLGRALAAAEDAVTQANQRAAQLEAEMAELKTQLADQGSTPASRNDSSITE